LLVVLQPAVAFEGDIMQKIKTGIIVLVALAGMAESFAFAQMGGMGGGMARPKRNLRKSRAPVLSPALNMLPGASQSFEGQFLMRQLPQEQAIKQSLQTGQALDKLQTEIVQNENQIKTGMKSTGHRTQFMNYGSYYSGGRGKGR
jgi:hypothetical protein